MATISGPDFITLLVSDLEISYDFYKEKIGLSEPTERQPNAHAFATKPCGFAIRQSPDKSKVGNQSQGIVIWLHTPDATALYNDLKKRGVTIVDNIRKSPFGMTFSFKDPDGYILYVHDARG